MKTKQLKFMNVTIVPARPFAAGDKRRLKASVESLDGIPEAYHELYEQTDDGYVFVGVDDADFLQRLAEFRNNNTDLKKARDELQEQLAKFKDIDPEKYKELKELQDRLDQDEEAKKIAEGKIDEVVNARTEKLRADLQGKIEALEKALTEEKTKNETITVELGKTRISSFVNERLEELKFKPRAGAMSDILGRVHNKFSLSPENSKDVIPVGVDGKRNFGKDGKDLSMDEFLTDLTEHASFLFEPGAGGGAGGGDGETGGKPTVDRKDAAAFGANLEKIAGGEVDVK